MKGLLISALIILLVHNSWAQDANPMTLQECIEYALQNNELGKIASLEKELAAKEVKKTIGTGLPQVEFNSGVNYNYQIQKSLLDVSNLDPSAPPGTEIPIAFGQDYDANFALSLKQLIFDGSFFVGLEASKTYQELSSKEHIKTQIDIVEAVSKAYYSVLINEERLELVQKNFQRLDTLLKETKAMNQSGFVEKIDVDRVQVNYNNLKVELDRLTQLSNLSSKLLKFQMGMPLNEPIVLSESLADLSPEKTLGASDFTYDSRIEFSQLKTNETLVGLDMKNNKAQYLPKLYAQFNYGYNTAASNFDLLMQGDRWLSFGTIGVTLNIPIFNGFIKQTSIQQNKIQLQQIAARKEMLMKNIDLEIEQSGITLNSSIDALEVQKQNMQLADDIYRITQIKYREGVGSNLEVMEADAALKEAQTNYFGSLYDAVIAQIELKKALGTLHN